MNDFSAFIFIAYFFICGIVTPLALLVNHFEERECAHKHQVFECKRGPFEPVPNKVVDIVNQ